MVEYTVFDYYPMEFITRDCFNERGICYGDGGKILLMVQGNNCQVPVTDEDEAFLNGRVFGHNHPGNSSLGTNDVEWGCRVGVSELRVSTVPYLYSLRPLYGWDEDIWARYIRPSIDRVGRELGIFDDEYNLDYMEHYFDDIDEDALKYENNNTLNEPWSMSELEPWAEMWARVADECGLEFRIMKW